MNQSNLIGGKYDSIFTMYSSCNGSICNFNKYKGEKSSKRIIGMVVYYRRIYHYDYLEY